MNFWISGQAARDLWFFPLVQDILGKVGVGRSCRVSEFRPHVVIASVLGDPENVDRADADVRVFFSGECLRSPSAPELEAYADHRAGSYDLSLGLEPEPSVGAASYMRFPLWILYYFSPFDTRDEIAGKVAAINGQLPPKSKFCAVVCRHDRSGIRGQMVDALASLGKIDSAGPWRHDDDSLSAVFADDKIAFLRQYRFTICPENARGEGYVTEKLFQAFEAGCIPIYNGSSDNPEPRVIDKDAILYWREGESNEELIARIRELDRDPAAFACFRQRVPLRPEAVDYVHERLQTLRERLEDALAPLGKPLAGGIASRQRTP
ncbi:MAG TPA: glycosyltransferase family 10 [Rectinemataceae bacterium]|nr:glycosyltransferase family 10 [Rectinemataceae bacterium]